MANTYGQVAFIDHNVGRILAELDELGLSKNTIVIYISDHGDWLGDHGLILKGPMLYEGLLRVPMIMRGPGVPASLEVDEPVSTMDISPTLLSLADVAPQLPQHGQSLCPLWQDGATRTFAMCEWQLLAGRVGVELSLRAVRTKSHKLTKELKSGAGELYDLGADPFEMENRFEDPAFSDVRAELEGYLDQRPDDMGPNRAPVGSA